MAVELYRFPISGHATHNPLPPLFRPEGEEIGAVNRDEEISLVGSKGLFRIRETRPIIPCDALAFFNNFPTHDLLSFPCFFLLFYFGGEDKRI